MEESETTPPELTDEPSPSRRPRRVVAGVALGALLVAAGAFGVSRGDDDPPAETVTDARTVGFLGRIDGTSIADQTRELEARVAAVPGDHVALATLGIAYVQQGRITGDPTQYDRADDVLARSLELNDVDNFVAETGLAAVAAARHDFASAERHALAGLDINPYSASLWGVLADAQIQLGKYDDGFAAVDRMGELSPDVASITRAAYVDELRGDGESAELLMQRALRDAYGADDRAFVLFQLGEVEMGAGRPESALPFFLQALEASPDDISALSGKAHSLGQTGDIDEAIATYELLLERAPLVDFMIEYGEFLEDLGRDADAEAWYDRARERIESDRAAGIEVEAGPLMFESDHGSIERALEETAAAVAERPFFELHEAHGWALYRNGRFEEAAAALERAASIGIEDPELFVRQALVFQALGQHDDARNALATATRINPLGQPYLTPSDEALLAEIDAP